MSEASKVTSIESLPQGKTNNTSVSDELARLMEPLQAEFPEAVAITFEYTGRLVVHIDVRTGEEIMAAKAKLEGLAGGAFSTIHNGATPHHPFFHRITADVRR